MIALTIRHIIVRVPKKHPPVFIFHFMKTLLYALAS